MAPRFQLLLLLRVLSDYTVDDPALNIRYFCQNSKSRVRRSRKVTLTEIGTDFRMASRQDNGVQIAFLVSNITTR